MARTQKQIETPGMEHSTPQDEDLIGSGAGKTQESVALNVADASENDLISHFRTYSDVTGLVDSDTFRQLVGLATSKKSVSPAHAVKHRPGLPVLTADGWLVRG